MHEREEEESMISDRSDLRILIMLFDFNFFISYRNRVFLYRGGQNTLSIRLVASCGVDWGSSWIMRTLALLHRPIPLPLFLLLMCFLMLPLSATYGYAFVRTSPADTH